MSGFDERCPHCKTKINNLNGIFSDHDYMSNFTFSCPSCDKGIECCVHSVPEFELSVPESHEEYTKRRLAMIKNMEDSK